MYKFLDLFFVTFHTALILFNLFGWIYAGTRKINLITLLLTGGSWFILGIFYGIGYCPLTDWHFRVLEQLGERQLPGSYIAYLLERYTGHAFNESWINRITMICYIVALVISVMVNRIIPACVRKIRP
jgi:hypothetical protein